VVLSRFDLHSICSYAAGITNTVKNRSLRVRRQPLHTGTLVYRASSRSPKWHVVVNTSCGRGPPAGKGSQSRCDHQPAQSGQWVQGFTALLERLKRGLFSSRVQLVHQLEKLVRWAANNVIDVFERRLNKYGPPEKAPPVQPYPKGYTNGAMDEDKTPSEYPKRKPE
jgi:hypothetical protein